VIRFDCKILKGEEIRLGIVGIEIENIYDSCDLKNFKERIFKVPLFDDLDEHIFYTSMASFKAQKPYIVLAFTPAQPVAKASPIVELKKSEVSPVKSVSTISPSKRAVPVEPEKPKEKVEPADKSL
jgi:hypothetical protein